MGRLGIAVLLVALGWPIESAWSQTVRYPRVYGATGRPYGPTQAHYQYQRQYGRPWHGYGGITANINSGVGYVNGYYASPYQSYGYGVYADFGGCGWDYGCSLGFSPFPSYTPPIPPVINGYPPAVPYNPLTDPAVSPLTNPAGPFGAGLNPLNVDPLPGANPLPPISTPEAKLKSVRAQAQGDQWFQQQEYHKAISRYKAAVSEAQDRGEAHMRLAVCYVALGHLDNAVRQIKRGMAVDPNFITKLEPLSKMFGPTNGIAQAAAVHKATLWAKDDIYDPDRLFLLGVLLYLQGDERSVVPLETGLALAGDGDHFRGFLAAAQTASLESAEEAPVGQNPNPGPEVIDQAPAPETQNPNPDGALPPLPNPPQSNPQEDSPGPFPTGPELSVPNS